MVIKKWGRCLVLAGLVFSLAACGVEKKPPLEVPATPTPTIERPEPVLTPQPAKVLSVCLGSEPNNLFLYGRDTLGSRVVRQALFDGPVDEVNFEHSPVLLERIPSRGNQDVQVQGVEVQPGEALVDASGNITFLSQGVLYRPSGCYAAECEEVYQGQEPVTVDQLSIQYHLRQGVLWSDGQPVRADDSVYSFRVARELYGTFGPPEIRFAEEYLWVDTHSVLWRGIPGYLGLTSYAEAFFTPLPQHRWRNTPPAQLANMQAARKEPLGWGPYMIAEWRTGKHLTLTENEHYFRIREGLPYFEAVVFRFVEEVSAVLEAFQAGECTIALGVPGLLEKVHSLEKKQEEGKLQVAHLYGGTWEQVVFGIRSRDPEKVFFQDSRTRQAIAKCVNREEMIRKLPEAPRIADSYYPSQHPAYNDEIPRYRYDPESAKKILEEVGWVDDDGTPGTVRVAKNVEGVEDGTPFQFQLLVSRSEKSMAIARVIEESLAECSIEVDVQRMPAETLLAAGPEGPVFGRSFDMAQFAWTPGRYQLCSLFLSREIPGPPPDFPKGWGGGNAVGYINDAFDAACRESLQLLPDHENTLEAQARAQEIFGEDLPVLPLYFRQEVLISARDLKGFDNGFYIPLYNVESLP